MANRVALSRGHGQFDKAMLIRKATIADAQSAFDIRIAAINSRCIGYYTPRDLKEWTAGTMSANFAKMVEDVCYVATVEDVVVGTGMIDLGSGKIDAIFVQPLLMGQGIGRRMMSYLEFLAMAARLTELRLDSTLNAASFYRVVGFVGDAVSTYKTQSGISLDCIPMVKDLRI